MLVLNSSSWQRAIEKLIHKIGKFYYICLNVLWFKALLKHRVASGVEHFSVLRSIGKIRTVVDVGANRGQFSLVARRCFSEAQIFSFEPLAVPAAVYRDVFGRDKNVSFFEVAIGPMLGEAIIHVSQRDDSSSLLPISPAQDQLFPGTAEAGVDTINVAPLSECIREIDIIEPSLLKIDVQGSELYVLEGCEDLLAFFNWTYIECSFIELYEGQALAADVIGWLRKRSFELCGFYNVSYDSDGRTIQADFLFRKNI